MAIYVKLVSIREIEEAPNEKNGILNYNCDANSEMLFADGYKIFVEIVRPQTDRHYEIQYAITSDTEISEVLVWTETDEEYAARKFSEAKTNKTNENNTKRNSIVAIKAYFSATDTGYLLRNTSVGDINTVIMGLALPAMIAQTSIPAGAMRYYDNEKEIHPTPEIAASFVPTFYQRFAGAIAGIDAYSADIDKQIREAETIEEVNAIVIDYTVIGVI